MNNKTSKENGIQGISAIAAEHRAEYKVIKHDLVRLFLLNLVYLAAVLFLYSYEQKTGFLSEWLSKILKF